jgi:hypothetical protein
MPVRPVNIVDELAAAEIRAALQGKRCWYAYSVAGTFAADFGRKVPRPAEDVELNRRLRKRRPAASCGGHPAEYDKFVGESHLLVWCTWRIDSASGPVASSDSDYGVCDQAVEMLIGKTAQRVEISDDWRVRVEISSGLVVNIFPDHIGPDASFDGNWELWRPDRVYSIETDLACQVQDRDNRPLRPQPSADRWQVVHDKDEGALGA